MMLALLGWALVTAVASQDAANARMRAWAAALGVECAHCHEADRAAGGKAPTAMVARMLPIFDEIPKYFDPSRMPTTQCFMCHQGARRPERTPGA